MELLKTIRVKAANWVDTTKIVEGTLFVADRITLEGADPERNQNGYLLFIVDDSGMKHIIAPDTLEIIEKEATSEVGKAVHTSFMKLYKAGFTFAQVENFWKDCMSSAEIMIESKKRGVSVVNVKEKELQGWDEKLIKAFGNLINDEGWLTSNWAEFLEENFKDWDEHGNDTNEKKELYQLMYNLDFETSDCGKFIKPFYVNFNVKPIKIFTVGEKIEHKKYGEGIVKEVFDFKITISFNSGKELKFVTAIFEQNLI